MEEMMLVCLVLFVLMALIVFAGQLIAKQKTENARWRERKKALLRMSDTWFKVYFEGCVAKNWSGISRKERRFIEAEVQKRKINKH